VGSGKVGAITADSPGGSMKILFVNPCLRPSAPHRYLPVGLGYVVTAVKIAGFKFDLLDVDIDALSDQKVEEYIAHHRHDAILIGSIVTHYKWVKWFCVMARQYHPHCTIIVGNSVGSSISEVILQYAPIDVVVLGEADVTVVELLQALNDGRPLGEAHEPEVPIVHTNGALPATIRGSGIEGIVFRDAKGRLVNTGKRKAIKKIDDLPFPDWDIFDVQRYITLCSTTAHNATTRFPVEKARVMPVNTARGCVFKCTFCHYVFWEDPYRHRSPESVIAEIRRNQKKYGANYINFWDELSFHKVKPAQKFLDALIKADLNIHFTAAVRSDLLGREEAPHDERVHFAHSLKKAGCISVGFSLESANKEILIAMNKLVEREYFGEQVKILKQAGIICNTSVIFGYPQETRETIKETVETCRRTNVYPSPGFLLPMPSTGMWKHAVENGFITDIDQYLTEMTERQDFSVNMTKMSDAELKSAVEEGLGSLANEFGLKFGGSLMKTGGENTHNRQQAAEIRRKANQNDSMNYANVIGSV
jgi:anaerobic magnesium-protoporphyrin IX monomethyl ester cyclase